MRMVRFALCIAPACVVPACLGQSVRVRRGRGASDDDGRTMVGERSGERAGEQRGHEGSGWKHEHALAFARCVELHAGPDHTRPPSASCTAASREGDTHSLTCRAGRVQQGDSACLSSPGTLATPTNSFELETRLPRRALPPAVDLGRLFRSRCTDRVCPVLDSDQTLLVQHEPTPQRPLHPPSLLSPTPTCQPTTPRRRSRHGPRHPRQTARSSSAG